MWTVKLDAHGYLCAEAAPVTDPAAACPPGWIFVEVAPPTLAAGEFARLDAAGAWSIDTDGPPQPEPRRRLIPKSVLQERVNAIGKWDAMIDAIMPDGRPSIFYARWFAPNHPNVYFDDPDLLAMLAAVGCTQAQIDAVTAP